MTPCGVPFGTITPRKSQKRAKKYEDKIAVPDEDDTASDQDWNFKAIESMSNRKGKNRLKNVEIKI
jgi:hypothetical protein